MSATRWLALVICDAVVLGFAIATANWGLILVMVVLMVCTLRAAARGLS